MEARKLVYCMALAALFLAATSANADLLVEEQFDYDVGLLDGLNGGTGFDGAWIWSKSHGQDYVIKAAGLELGALPVGGRSLGRGGNAGRAEAHRLFSSGAITALTGDNTTVWFSVLFQPTNANRGAMFLFSTQPLQHTALRTFAVAGDAFGFSTANPNTGPISAVAFNNSTNATFIPGSTYTPAVGDPDTHHVVSLIVGKINWKPNGTPDEFFLFNVTDINSEPAEGTAFASITNLDFDQSAFNQVAIADGVWSTFDEIRFGNTFANVTTDGTSGEVIPDATVIPTKANFTAGESIVIDYANGTGSAANMIGINPSGQAGPFWDPGLWLYIGGAQTQSSANVNGQLTFTTGSDGTATWPLADGEYVALFFTDETRAVLLATSETFTVGGSGGGDGDGDGDGDADPGTTQEPEAGMPVAGVLGLGLLAGAAALGGSMFLRKK